MEDRDKYKLNPISPAVKEMIAKEKRAVMVEKKIDTERSERDGVDLASEVASEINIHQKKSEIFQKKMTVNRGVISNSLVHDTVVEGVGKLTRPARYLRGKVRGALKCLQMTFRLDENTKRILKEISLNDKISMSEIINRALWCYLTVRSQYERR
jgi:hypothetical protein